MEGLGINAQLVRLPPPAPLAHCLALAWRKEPNPPDVVEHSWCIWGSAEQASLLLGSAQGDELDLLPTQLDLKLIARLQPQLGGVGLSDHQVAVELHLGGVAQAATGTALAATAAGAEVHALGLEQGFIESREVQALGAVLLGVDITSGTNQVRLGPVTEFLDLGQ